MTNANATVSTDLLEHVPDKQEVTRSQTAIASTGDPIMDMAQRASQNNDVDTLKALLQIRDDEQAKQAKRAFNSAFANAQSEMPAIPKRGTGHNKIKYAKIEDVFRIAMPVLSQNGLSLRHRVDTSNGVTVTAILAHVDGHSEENTFTAQADGSGSKNAIQALGSSITYGKRYTAEAILGLTSHGEDDDAFAAGDTDNVSRWRGVIANCKQTKAAHMTMRGDIVKDTSLTGPERANVERMFKEAVLALPKSERENG